jgi:hypothetical protein
MGVAQLQDYSFGRIVVDGEEHDRDVIVLPGRVVANWWRRDGRLQPPAAVLQELERRGIDVEVLHTGDAVRRYGELDERRTAAALHLTC